MFHLPRISSFICLSVREGAKRSHPGWSWLGSGVEQDFPQAQFRLEGLLEYSFHQGDDYVL